MQPLLETSMCYTPHFYKDENRNSEPVKSQSLREEFRYLYPSCIYRSASTWEFTVTPIRCAICAFSLVLESGEPQHQAQAEQVGECSSAGRDGKTRWLNTFLPGLNDRPKNFNILKMVEPNRTSLYTLFGKENPTYI